MNLSLPLSFRLSWLPIVAGLVLLATALPRPAAAAEADDSFELVTAAEAQAEARAEADAPPRSRGLPSAREPVPSIRVLSPSSTATPVPPPLRIEVAFKAGPGSRILPSTFRVLYGLLKIDLTERSKKNTTVTENGVVIEGAQMPAGQHRFVLQVADDQGNLAEQEVLLRVGGAS